MTSDPWRPAEYQTHAGFVPELGTTILGWLNPKPGERILDLGCGDGSLTSKIAAAGAEVVGVDASAAMVAQARSRGLDARVCGGEALAFSGEFDAVFSNAALHWMRGAREVATGVCRALRPGGRFVAEFGGHGNVAAIVTALRASVAALSGDSPESPWFFPTAEEYRALLGDVGFQVERAELVPRPTPLPTDVAGWMDTFAFRLLGSLPEELRQPARDRAVELLRPALCDRSGRWHADYVRLRVAAQKGGELGPEL